jgi:site-specific DNA-methyltransferase (adenine-specific)
MINDNSVDFIMADPPYGISRNDTFGQGTGNLSSYTLNQGDWDVYDLDFITECVSEFKRILKRGGSIIIWYDIWKMGILKDLLEKNCLKQIRLAEWIKTNPPPITSNNSYLPNAKEYFVYAAKNTSYKKEWFTATFNSSYDKGIYEYPIAGKSRIHPTEKPFNLMEDIILKHTKPNDLVYIPFMGSGVDISVCMYHKLDVIGSETDQVYYENILKRLNI